jgi:hypothetical protein
MNPMQVYGLIFLIVGACAVVGSVGLELALARYVRRKPAAEPYSTDAKAAIIGSIVFFPFGIVWCFLGAATILTQR